MSSKTRNIIRNIDNQSSNKKVSNFDYQKAYEIMDKMEEEKNKDESTKQHEKFLRKIKKASTPVELEIKEAKKIETKPGQVFEGPLSVLVRKYKTIDEIFSRMTMGQLLRWYVKGNKIYRAKDGKLAYDEETGEIFLEN